MILRSGRFLGETHLRKAKVGSFLYLNDGAMQFGRISWLAARLPKSGGSKKTLASGLVTLVIDAAVRVSHKKKVLRLVLTDVANELRENGALDEEECFIDATFVMAKGGGSEIGPTKSAGLRVGGSTV